MTYKYIPRGICASMIEVTVENGLVQDVQIIGGCDGNHKGLISLVKGMKVEDVVDRLQGITCGRRSTSCPDQLSKALQACQEA